MYTGSCSIGYAATDSSGHVGYVTAGHCFDGTTGGGYWWWNVYQPNYRGSNYVGTPTIVEGDGDYVDTGFTVWNEVSPEVLTLNPDTGEVEPLLVYGYIRWSTLVYWNSTGYWVTLYKTGRTTGVTYGTFEKVRTSFTIPDGSGRTLNYAVFASFDVLPGDSGGPIYIYYRVRMGGVTMWTVKLVGIVSYLTLSGGIGVSVDGIRMELGITPITYG